jgi:hypothetical protein
MCFRDQKLPVNPLPFRVLIAALCLAFSSRAALAADEPQPAQAVPVKATAPQLPDRITTLDGKTYEKVTLEKVLPDGLLVRFAPAEGGSGTAKLKFRNLPPELRERFGYDAARASDFETAQSRGEAAWLAESAAWTEQRRAALAEQATREAQMRADAEARLAAQAEQGRLEAEYNVQEPGYYYPGWWGGNYNRHDRTHISHHNQNHIQQLPASGVRSSPISPNIGPMRPGGR